MSDPESFAARWSRLKRATAKEQQEAACGSACPQPADAAPAVPTDAAGAGSGRTDAPPEAPFDPEELAADRFHYGRKRHQGFSAGRRPAGFDPGGAPARLDNRSGDPRLHRTGGKPVGLHRSRRQCPASGRSKQPTMSVNSLPRRWGGLAELTEVAGRRGGRVSRGAYKRGTTECTARDPCCAANRQRHAGRKGMSSPDTTSEEHQHSAEVGDASKSVPAENRRDQRSPDTWRRACRR